MINDEKEALKILSLAMDTLVKDDEYYEIQKQVQSIPGALTALGMLAKKYKSDPDTMRLAMLLGIYLTLRNQETQNLTKLYGDIR